MAVFSISDDLYGIDLYEERRPGRSSAYFIRTDEPILVETGSAASHEALIAGLAEIGVSPIEIRHIVITHVHLDHAGGAGQMMAKAPKALLHCHPQAARHVVNPSRLEAGARAVYGDQMEQIFGSLLPVPEDRVVIQDEGSVLDAGNRSLIFYDAPGHAKHHTCALDTMTRGLFSGDTVGIRYTKEYTGWDFLYGFPTTTPSDFDPDVMLKTLDRLESLGVDRIYHTHFGVTEPAAEAFRFSRRGIAAIQRMLPKLSPESRPLDVELALKRVVAEDLAQLGHGDQDATPLALDMMLNSLGILVYMQKKAAGKF